MDVNELKKHEGEDTVPHAGSMIESFRSIGYSLQTAIADIIDNSIAAKAKNVWIDFDWTGSDTSIVITDDGVGMSRDELIEAMRLGSKNPLSDRSATDLGRFGLGLKTASFSQCRILTVSTKSIKSELNYRCWNLDYVSETGEWRLLNYLDDINLIVRLQTLESGTAVIWQHMDRLVEGTRTENEDHLNNFLDLIKEMEKHLQMVFHQYLERGILNIWIRDQKILPWDPYLKKNYKTKVLDKVKLRNDITVQPYILPHHSKIDKADFDKGSWIKGWNAHQGFYIYRNGRMIISGEWLGMYKQEEHHKLARILVNIPNTVSIDNEWHIDIKKSKAYPPYDIRQKLKRIADEARKEAVKIYRQIGKTKIGKSDKEGCSVWIEKKWKGKRCYQINKGHPLIKSFLDENKTSKKKINYLFRLIEETVPLPMIVINESENQDGQNIPFEGKALGDLVSMVIDLYNSLIENGSSKEGAIEEILRTEPFNHYPELAEHIDQQDN